MAQITEGLTIPEAAKLLNVSVDTVRRRIRNGELKAIKVKQPNLKGERWIIPFDEIGAAKEIREVVPVERALDIRDFAAMVTNAVADINKEQNDVLLQEIGTLRNEITELKELVKQQGLPTISKKSWLDKLRRR